MRVVRSLEEFVAVTSRLSSGTPGLWFRGVGRHTHRLTPSLYRLGDPRWTSDTYLDLEERLVERFRERSLPYRGREAPVDEIGYLFEMQHYGAPTRLLDWSENAFMALWFALEQRYLHRARVWALDPSAWNKCIYPNRSDVDRPLSPTSEVVNGWLAWRTPKRSQLSDLPLCIYGMHNSTRIVGQRGVFTLSGLSRRPLDEQAAAVAASGWTQIHRLLVPLDIPANARESVRLELARLGFSRSMVYPDLVGLAQELAERAKDGTL